MNKYDKELLASIRLKLANAQASYEEIEMLKRQENAITSFYDKHERNIKPRARTMVDRQDN